MVGLFLVLMHTSCGLLVNCELSHYLAEITGLPFFTHIWRIRTLKTERHIEFMILQSMDTHKIYRKISHYA